MAYEGYSPFDGVVRGPPIHSAVMAILAEQTKIARLRMAAAQRGGGGAVGDDEAGGAAGASPAKAALKAPAAGALAEHVRRQITGFDRPGEPGSGRDAAAVAAAAAAVAAAAGGDGAARAAPLSFLQAAAERAIARDVERRRNLIAASTRAAAAAGGSEASSACAAAASGGGGVAFSVVFRYHEGFTNAVRRPVRLADFVGRASADAEAAR